MERIGPMNSLKTPKPLLALRMVFPLAASLIVLLLGCYLIYALVHPEKF